MEPKAIYHCEIRLTNASLISNDQAGKRIVHQTEGS